jgi:hypothetical protein
MTKVDQGATLTTVRLESRSSASAWRRGAMRETLATLSVENRRAHSCSTSMVLSTTEADQGGRLS